MPSSTDPGRGQCDSEKRSTTSMNGGVIKIRRFKFTISQPWESHDMMESAADRVNRKQKETASVLRGLAECSCLSTQSSPSPRHVSIENFIESANSAANLYAQRYDCKGGAPEPTLDIWWVRNMNWNSEMGCRPKVVIHDVSQASTPVAPGILLVTWSWCL